jgi:hypothetical protein
MPAAAHSRVLASWPMDKHQNIQIHAANSYCSVLWRDASPVVYCDMMPRVGRRCRTAALPSQHIRQKLLHKLGNNSNTQHDKGSRQTEATVCSAVCENRACGQRTAHLLQQPQHWFGITELWIYWVSNCRRGAANRQVLCCYSAHCISLKRDMLQMTHLVFMSSKYISWRWSYINRSKQVGGETNSC